MKHTTNAPVTRSSAALRALATLVTLGSFTGASVFAAGHLYNADAPLQPSAAGIDAAGAGPALRGSDDDDADERSPATPAPTATPATRTRSRTTITPSVGTTSRRPTTRTRQS